VYLAEFEKAISWAALPTTEKALTGTGARADADSLSEVRSGMA
jgi:hypothetical protein